MPALSTGTLTAQKLPASSTATIDWSSTDTSVVQVNSNGAVQANSYGKARIIADPSTVGISDSCTVYVRYNDVNDISEYYFRPVNWMTYNGIANGYNNQTEYRPEGTCTRGQYCSMLYRLNGSPSVGNVTNPFSDITPATTHYTAIMWAYSQGIVGGYSDGTFKPTRVCSRANVALMLWKFAGHPSVSIATLPFSDISNLSTSVQQAIVWGYSNNIIGGYSDGTFKPENDCLRRQVSTYLFKYARNGITTWTCTGCGHNYSSESAMENHYNAVDHNVHYSTSVPVTATFTVQNNVAADIELLLYYYGGVPWGLTH